MRKRALTRAALIISLALAVIVIMGFIIWRSRLHWTTGTAVPAVSDEILVNPDCGTYHIYGFRPGSDSADQIIKDVWKDNGTSLELLEIDLEDFSDGDISDEALDEIEDMFSRLSDFDKDLIVRFLYDWNGTVSLTEPYSIDVILRHMEQVGPILLEYKEYIYTLQGLFIGNWGEMNGSRFQDAESLKTLAAKLYEVTGGGIRMSVRTPAQWRIIENVSENDLTEDNLKKLAAGSMLGLFNDALTGSSSDYGTYASDTEGIYESLSDDELVKTDLRDFDPQKSWPRDPELLFQNIVCRIQPCGGEAINVNSWNDIGQAVRSFERMHVSYLNEDYDEKVWEKWDGETYDGMSGSDYIRTRLGYRYVLEDAVISYRWLKDVFAVNLTIRNLGFAPAYQTLTVRVIFSDEEGNVCASASAQLDPAILPGGNESEKSVSLKLEIPAGELQEGEYQAKLQVVNEMGKVISMANEDRQEDEDGNAIYPFGTVST